MLLMDGVEGGGGREGGAGRLFMPLSTSRVHDDDNDVSLQEKQDFFRPGVALFSAAPSVMYSLSVSRAHTV